MKRILLLSAAILLGLSTLTAQIRTPQPSPLGKVMQTIGLTEVTVEYSRPGVKGREIFGGLVPYGEVWRTGANMATKISFSDDVKLHGNEIPAGEYALLTVPGEDEWTVIINKNPNGNIGNYKEEEDLVRFEVEPSDLSNKVETFLIGFENVKNDGADLFLAWENTWVTIPIEVPTETKVMANIEDVMAGPSANDYYSAARYYYESDKDLDQALTWIDKSLEMRPAFWVATWKARILGKMGDSKKAIKAAKEAKKMADEAGNEAYVRMNEEMIAEWSKK